MSVLKIKDWFKFKNGKQFKPLMETVKGAMIVSAERFLDKQVFDIDQCIYRRDMTIKNENKELKVFVVDFFQDHVHVNLRASTKMGEGRWFESECHTVEINSMEEMAPFLINDLALKLAAI